MIHWTEQIPPERRRHLRAWFLSGAALTLLIVMVGGITRLTNSGLSMVDWKPIMGVIPPLGEAQWEAAFEQYRQFPEYQKLRAGMSLAEFKFIFFWEYTHRLLARVIGLVFLVPFAFFALRGYFRGPLLPRVLALFALGGLQGFVGWFMVRSGLVDDPRVSHYRLALHLFMALTVFGLCLWLAHEMRGTRRRAARPPAAPVWTLGGLLLLQILWGAFVAGLDAGLYYNTFPRMGGQWLPPGGLAMEPSALNLVANPITVQWVHRVLGTVLLLAAAWVWLRMRRRGDDVTGTRLAGGFFGLLVVQYGLGIATLLLFVPVSLGVLHQVVGVVLFAVWLTWLHRTRVEVVQSGAALAARTGRRPAVRLVG